MKYLTLFLIASCIYSLPIAVFHGVGDMCINPGMKRFTQELGEGVEDVSYCIEIGNGSMSSWLMDFQEQAQKGCANLKKHDKLKGDIIVVGLSQGSLLARYIVESCDFEGQVVKYLSIGGPQMGVESIPHCGGHLFCYPINYLAKSMVYNNGVQGTLGPAGYFRDPYNYEVYLKQSHFLPDLNNERNFTEERKTRFSSLKGLMLVKFSKDTMIYPRETAWFQSHDSNGNLQELEQMEWYKQDLIGLKQLKENGKAKFVEIQGQHLEFSQDDIQNIMIPFLKE